MKTFFKKILAFLIIIGGIVSIYGIITPQTVSAAKTGGSSNSTQGTGTNSDGTGGQDTTNGNCRTFLGMVSWDCGANTEVKSEADLQELIIKIIENITSDVLRIAAYIALGFALYGGYQYIFSSGDAGKVAKGKKTLIQASIGLAIIACSNVILDAIIIAFTNNKCNSNDLSTCYNTSADTLTNSAIDWFISIAGITAAAFLVVGGIGYITAAGDAGKLKKAKDTLFYSAIGLVIVGLSRIAVNFVVGIVNGAAAKGKFSNSLQSILNQIISVASVVAFVFVVLGGYRYMTSAGNPEKVKLARHTILYSCIGLVVCALAFVAVNWLIGIIYPTTPKA